MADKSMTRVYVVDDEEVIATSIAEILNLSGFSAAAFNDPIKVIEASQFESPGLLISDIVMPGMSGIDLAIKLKNICPDCNILLLSGQANTLDHLKIANEDGLLFTLLSKPVHPTDLLAAIKRLESE